MPWNFSDMYGRQKVVDANVFPVMVPIFDTVLSASQATIDIQNIPATYAHLQLVLVGRTDNAVSSQSSYIRFNGDAGANYADQVIRGAASTATAIEDNSTANAFVGYTAGASAVAGHVGISVIDIPNYAGTTFFKPWTGTNFISANILTGGRFETALGAVWANTAAINRITWVPAAGNFVAGTRVTLYGLGVIAPASPGSVLPVTYGTSLPASPLDGQEAILVDNTSTPTYQWRFRYNANSFSSYKWEFVGGTDAISEIQTAESTSSTTYADLTTIGPQFTIPRSGEYEIQLAFNWYGNNVSSGAAVKLGAAATAVTEGFSTGAGASGAGAGNNISNAGRVGGSKTFKRTLSAGDLLKMQYRVDTVTSTFADRTLLVRPVRVS